MEHVVVALWRHASLTVEECHARLRGEWVENSLTEPSVQAVTLSLADRDQGPYTRPADDHGCTPNVDAMCALGLERAHDLDDIPSRDLLHAISRRIEVWRVDVRRPLDVERVWPLGEVAPGLKMVSFMRREETLTHEQFVRHWTEQHTPLAIAHHPGLWRYTQNIVRRAFTPGGDEIDGIAELHFHNRLDFETRFFDSDAGREVIMADVRTFMRSPGSETTLMHELPLLDD